METEKQKGRQTDRWTDRQIGTGTRTERDRQTARE